MTDKKGIKEQWNEQSNKRKALMGIVGVCCLGIILIIVIGGMVSPDAINNTDNQTKLNQTTTNETTSAKASIVFENKYYKFTIPEGTTVKDSDGNLAPQGGDNENLQLWDPAVNTKDIDGKEIGYAEISTGRMDGDAQNSLIELGYTSSKSIAGYQSYYDLTPASGDQEAYYEYLLILGESKEQPGRIDTLGISFDSDTADKLKIVMDSLVIKNSVIK